MSHFSKYLSKWLGTNGDDQLEGSLGNDWLFGRRGNDILKGYDGRDKLFGGHGDDVIHAGAGSDYIHAGRGDDTVFHNISENVGSKDYYKGGKGHDTLVVQATVEQRSALEDSGVLDLSATKHGKVDFSKVDLGFDMNLKVKHFEDIVFDLNAHDDMAVTDEETAVEIDVLANDEILSGDALHILSIDDSALEGSVVIEDGKLIYTPGEAFDALNDGESAEETFSYLVESASGATHSADVTVTINGVTDGTGVIDTPSYFCTPFHPTGRPNSSESEVIDASGHHGVNVCGFGGNDVLMAGTVLSGYAGDVGVYGSHSSYSYMNTEDDLWVVTGESPVLLLDQSGPPSSSIGAAEFLSVSSYGQSAINVGGISHISLDFSDARLSLDGETVANMLGNYGTANNSSLFISGGSDDMINLLDDWNGGFGGGGFGGEEESWVKAFEVLAEDVPVPAEFEGYFDTNSNFDVYQTTHPFGGFGADPISVYVDQDITLLIEGANQNVPTPGF